MVKYEEYTDWLWNGSQELIYRNNGIFNNNVTFKSVTGSNDDGQ